MTEHRKAQGAIIVTVLFWGLSFISIKIAVPVLPPMTLGAARFALALVFLYFVKRAFAPAERLELRDLPYLAGAGLIGVTAYFYFENNGVLLVTASEASIIVAAIPVLTMVADAVFRRSASVILPRQWAGALLSMGGVWLTALPSLASSGSGLSLSAAGYLFMAGACLSWVAYSFLTRSLFERKSRIYIVFWQSLFGFLGFLPFAAFEQPRWDLFSLPVALHVAYLGLFCSALGYWFYVHALRHLGVSEATVFINLIPVVTVAAGFFFLGERLLPLQWAGAAVVMAGVYLATLEGRPRSRFPYHSREKAKPNS